MVQAPKQSIRADNQRCDLRALLRNHHTIAHEAKNSHTKKETKRLNFIGKSYSTMG